MKIKVTIIKFGYIDHLIEVSKLKKWKSDLFEIVDIESVGYLPNCDIEDGYLDQKYAPEQLNKFISCPNSSDFAIAIMQYRFCDNFYMHRINGNSVGISLHGISEILERDNISIENFIIKQIYEVYALKSLFGNTPSEDVYKAIHQDTRGCLFDQNGYRSDIQYNTEKPIICDSCKGLFKSKQVNTETLQILEKELKRIDKALLLKFERFVRKQPLISLILSASLALSLSILANLIFRAYF